MEPLCGDLIFYTTKNSRQRSYGYAVVGDGNILFLGAHHAAHHVAAVEHTRSAMYHKVVGCQILGEICATDNIYRNLLAQLSTQHTGQLHTTYILVLGRMCAGLGYKDSSRCGE